MPEGTRSRDANEFIEATERLGAEVHADATWETLSAGVEVPRSRFGPALALLAEMVTRARLSRRGSRAPARRAAQRPDAGVG